ncbi:hypothetical protein PRNP1_011211 [Phytophthora ramorum]
MIIPKIVHSPGQCQDTHGSSGQKAPKPPPIKMLYTFLQKLPLSQGGKVFVGTSICLAICAYPVIRKQQKAGHDLFSSERPQAIVDQEVQARREKLKIE